MSSSDNKSLTSILAELFPKQNPPAKDKALSNWRSIETLHHLDPELPNKIPKNEIGDEVTIDKLGKYGLSFGQVLGRGSYGTIFHCKLKNEKIKSGGCELAAKRVSIFRSSDWDEEKLTEQLPNAKKVGKKPSELAEEVAKEMEINELIMINPCQNIVVTYYIYKFYYDNFPLPYNNIVFNELCQGDVNTLLNEVGPFSIDDSKKMAIHLANALSFLHHHPKRTEEKGKLKNIVIGHCDVRLDNILYRYDDSGRRVQFKLTDFGLAIKYEPGQNPVFTGERGSPYSRAPETKDHDHQQNTWNVLASDVFAFGLAIVSVRFPGSLEPLNLIINGNWETLQHNYQVDDKMLKFLKSNVCSHDPKKRCHISEVVKDVWFKDFDFQLSHDFVSLEALDEYLKQGDKHPPTEVGLSDKNA